MQRPLPAIAPSTVETFTISKLIDGWNDNTNQDSITDTQFSDGRNVEVTQNDTIEPRKGTIIRGNYLGNTTKILGLFEYIKFSTGARALLCAYGTDYYVLTGTDWEPGGVGLTVASPAQFTNFLDRAYVTSKGNTTTKLGLNYYDGSSWTNVPNFPVSSATASDIPAGLCVHKQRMIAWNTANNPKRVYYSDQNAQTIGSLNYFDVAEPVQVCVPLYDYLLVFTENYIYQLGSFVFSGVAFQPDNLKPIPTQIGCIAPRTAKVVGQACYFLSKVGLMKTDGLNVANISDAKIKGYLESTTNHTILTTSSAGVDRQYYRLQLSVGGTVHDEMITYDTNSGAYFSRANNFNCSCFSNFFEAGAQGFFGGSDTDGTVIQFLQDTYYDEQSTASSLTAATTDNPIDANPAKRVAQSFQVSGSVAQTITKVGVWLKKNAGTTTELAVRIETDSGGKPSGTLVSTGATGTITAFSTTSYRFKVSSLITAVSLVPNTIYWLVVQHTTEGSGSSQYYWGSDSAGAYTGGNLATYASSSWTAVAAHDGLFAAWYESGYEKYFITRGYNLGYPEFQKILKRVYIEIESSGKYFANIGINTDIYTYFQETMVSLTGNAPIRGSSLTRGAFTRGTTQKADTFIKVSSLRGRRIKLRVYNNNAGEKFTFHSAVLNYIVRKIAR